MGKFLVRLSTTTGIIIAIGVGYFSGGVGGAIIAAILFAPFVYFAYVD